MSKPTVIEHQPRKGDEATRIAAAAEMRIVGLVKVGPNRYSVVTGTVATPVIDPATEPLEYASQALGRAALHLVNTIK